MEYKKTGSAPEPMADMAAEVNRLLIEGLPKSVPATVALLRQRGFTTDQIRAMYERQHRELTGDEPSFFMLGINALLEQTDKPAAPAEPGKKGGG